MNRRITRKCLNANERLLEVIVGYPKYKVGKRYGYYAIDAYNRQGGCLRTLITGLTVREADLYLNGIMEGMRSVEEAI